MSIEAELNAVKKLEANKFCANCDAFSKFGHGNVCEKFRTFVCSNCKSAHQSFSMRVKSVSMSNWSKDEVDALREENGGGNALAKRVWLGTWDETQMRKPTDKDHVDYFKKFINRVYNDRAFYADAPAAGKAMPRKDSSGSQRRASPAPMDVNLLDFGAQPVAAPMSPSADSWGAFVSAPAPAVPRSTSDGFGDFAAFSSAPPTQTQSSFDPFGVGPQATAVAPVSTQAFDPFGVSAQAPVQPVSFDPFGPSALLQPVAHGVGAFTGGGHVPAPNAPGLAAGKNFSAFDALNSPNLAFGGHSHAQPQPQFHQHGMLNGGGGYHQQQHPHMMSGGSGYNANAGASISAFMTPSGSHAVASSGVGFVRQAPVGGGSRDPFAGLGLPHH